jgi:hypothetical protein
VYTEKHKALDPFHYSRVNVDGAVLGPPFPVVHDQLHCLADVEGEVVVLATHIIGDQDYTTIVPSANLMMVLELCEATQSWVNREYRRTKHAPLRGPLVEGQCGRCVVGYPQYLGVSPIRESRIQLQREVFSPRVLSLVMSLDGATVLNAEL